MSDATTDTTLRAQGLHYQLGARTILEEVSFDVRPGDCIALLGANGAGKSTLLKILLGLLQPQAGQVRLNGRDLHEHSRQQVARQLAYVPQSHTPSFPFSVEQIVAQGRLPISGLGRAPSREDWQVVNQALADMQVEHLAGRVYTELSGGERQRVLIARALAQQTRLILLDEPITGLDYGHQLRLLKHLQHLAAQGYGILATTHRPEHALESANRALVLHQGRLLADGTPHEVVTAELIARLYQVEVRQIECSPYRFFVPSE
ncbi:ABC transporter ATP-binding protein [Azomonas macrocytogenes]|uniref:Iron complex transport system ATP-binding protein n=1 Tax=Azomonas macrocytogenes TaxID=69962 RepID=A0A839T137_AZOMA|nr:ABC transporter ATP-binding protein [Azomonas macrocytogenes]MBB3103102.1 iron complex transport system ATP-binding protein [Azomonas macrocytogenes]